MIQEHELKYINKLFDEPSLIFETRLKATQFQDPLAITLFKEITLSMMKHGEFIPGYHLTNLVNDEDRMFAYEKINYPLEISSVNDIISFVGKYSGKEKPSTLESYITDKYTRKKMKIVAEQLLEYSNSSTVKTSEVLRKASLSIDDLLYTGESDVEAMSVQEIIAEELRYQESDEVIDISKTGIKLIDLAAGGVSTPSTNYIVATSKSGKSIGLYNSLIERLKQGKTAIFATIEINTRECYHKILSCYTGIEYNKIKSKTMDREERALYLSKLQEFEMLYADRLYIYYNRGGVSTKDIEAYYNLLDKAGTHIDDIFVDYLAIMQSSDPSKKAQVEVMLSLPKEIRVLSQKTNTAIFTAQQLSTAAETKDIEDISYDDIWFSKTIPHEATNIIVFQRKEENNEIAVYCKFLPSRTSWIPGVYKFVDLDFDKCYMGDIEEKGLAADEFDFYG